MTRAIMNTDPNATTTGAPSGRRWRKRAAAAAAGALLIGAGVLGATAASAGTSPSPAPSLSAATASAHTSGAQTPGAQARGAKAPQAAAKHPGRRPEVRLLRRELRIDIQAKPGFGDKAHVVAYGLIHHPAAFATLPAQLRTDLLSLEAAAAGSRDADAASIKDTALGGGYGATIQKEAKAIAARLAAAPATRAPATQAPASQAPATQAP